MAAQKILVVNDVFEFGAEHDRTEDARVTVDGDNVIIQPHDSKDKVQLMISRDDWQAIVEYVRWVWQPPTMGGRE